MARRWGNALGGWRRQRRNSKGQFSSGFSGSVGTNPGQRRAQYLQKQKRKSQAKTAAKVVGGAAVAAGAGYLAYQNRDTISGLQASYVRRRTLNNTMTPVFHNAGSNPQPSRDWMNGVAAKSKKNSERSSGVKTVLGATTVAATATRNIKEVNNNVRRKKPQGPNNFEPAVAERYNNVDHSILASKQYRANLRNETLGGIADPKPGNIRDMGKVDMNPGTGLAGVSASRVVGGGGRQSTAAERMAEANRKTAGGYKTMTGAMKDRGDNFHGGDFMESDSFAAMMDDERGFTMGESVGVSRNVKPPQRRNRTGQFQGKTLREAASPQALAGVARARAVAEQQRRTRAARHQAGVNDPTIGSVLPNAHLSPQVPLLTTPEPSRSAYTSKGYQTLNIGTETPQTGALGRTAHGIAAAQERRFLNTLDTVPQINQRYGGSLATTKNYDFVKGKGKNAERVKGTKILGERYKDPRYQDIASPFEEILAAEKLAPVGGTNVSLGSYRSTNEIAGTSSAATGWNSANTVFYGGSFEDESWKFKNRRA